MKYELVLVFFAVVAVKLVLAQNEGHQPHSGDDHGKPGEARAKLAVHRFRRQSPSGGGQGSMGFSFGGQAGIGGEAGADGQTAGQGGIGGQAGASGQIGFGGQAGIGGGAGADGQAAGQGGIGGQAGASGQIGFGGQAGIGGGAGRS